MKGKHPLITHPVGRLNSAARWYLAAITMLALVLVAAHFAMQVFAQEEAKRLVADWQKRTGITIGDVRYRMLRGALTLVDLRYTGEGVDAYLPTLFLQGNLTALTDAHPKAAAIDIRDAQLSMTIAAFEQLAAGRRDALFADLWNGSRHVGFYQTKIDLLPEPGALFPAAPSRIDLVSMEREPGRVRGAVRLFGGELNVALQSTGGGEEPGQQGHLSWQGCEAAGLLRDLAGLMPVAGTSSGDLEWKSQKGKPWRFDVNGSVAIESSNGTVSGASLSWKGLLKDGRWQGESTATGWPVTMFSRQLPQFQSFAVTGGRLTGALDIKGDFRTFHLSMQKGRLSELRLHRDGGERTFPDWYIGSAEVSGAEIAWPERRLKIDQVNLGRGSIALDPEASDSNPDWRIAVGRLRVEKVRAGVALQGGVLMLPALQGNGSLTGGGHLKLALSSIRSEDDDAIAAVEGGIAEQWHLSGSGNLHSGGKDRFGFDIEAKGAPLVRFRPLLPKAVRREASAVSGEVSLKLHMLAGTAAWELNGAASVTDAGLDYGGDSWSARRINIGFDRIGSSLPLQQIGGIDVDGWRYQASLSPLPVPGVVGPGEAVDTKTPDPEPWHIRKLDLKDGVFAVGQADAVWLQDARIQVADLYPGHEAPVELRAKLDDGLIALNGSLVWESAEPQLADAKLSVRDVLPFFMNEWLSVSSAPKIIRGRIYADITMERQPQGEYGGMGYLRLQQGQLGSTLSGDDPLLLRVGMNSHDLFAMLHGSGRIRMQVPISGRGDVLDVLGTSFIASIRKSIEKRGFTPSLKPLKEGDLLSSVRLHESGSLTHNERTRLRKVITRLRKSPKRSIELKPQLSMASQMQEDIARVRYTQKLIESFLSQRGISRSRIFPVWPGEQHRSGGSSGISILSIP